MRTIALCLLLAACSSNDPSCGPPGSGGTAPGARSETVSVSTSLVVPDVRAAAGHLRSAVERLGGHVASSDLGEDGAFARLTLRAPASELGALREALDGLDGGRSESELRRDVTSERADTSARSISARAAEARLLSLLEDRTATLADVLAVQAELARARERVEVLEAEDRVAADRVALAEVQISLRAEVPTPFEDPAASIAGAFAFGLRATLAVGLGLALTVTALLPGLSVLAVLLLLGRWLLRARRPVSA